MMQASGSNRKALVLFGVLLVFVTHPVFAQNTEGRRHNHHVNGKETNAYAPPETIRSIDGVGNNPDNLEFGSTHSQLLRIGSADPDYADGVSSPAGEDRPSARAISNEVFSQQEPVPTQSGATDFVWQWGQFLDHDIDLTEGAVPSEVFNIPVPLKSTTLSDIIRRNTLINGEIQENVFIMNNRNHDHENGRHRDHRHSR